MAPQLRYPVDRLLDGDSDYLSITVVEYTPPGLGSAGGANNIFTAGRGSETNAVGAQNAIPKGSILLPMPDSLQDSNTVDWTDDSLTALGIAGMETAQSLLNALKLGGGSDGGASLKKTLESAGAAALDNNVLEALKNALKAGAVNTFGANVDPKSLVTRTQGLVLNPNLELLFKGPKLRSFSFPFTLTARSQREAQVIKGIINTFKKRMAANDSTGGSADGIFISSPDVFNLEFKRGGAPHPFLFKFKTCALTGMDVNYTDGTPYITYRDGTPVKMSMILKFTELNPIYSSDYDEDLPGLNQGVGF